MCNRYLIGVGEVFTNSAYDNFFIVKSNKPWFVFFGDIVCIIGKRVSSLMVILSFKRTIIVVFYSDVF